MSSCSNHSEGSQGDRRCCSTKDASCQDVDASIIIPSSGVAPKSVYDLWSQRRRYIILFTTALAAILLPFTDTIYLPALGAIQLDLATSAELVASSVAIYMFTAGLGGLVWGPASDRFGRRVTYFVAGAIFLATSIVCIFAPSIGILVAFRALQGAAVAAFLTTGNGVLADIFPPEQRGTASGLFMISLLIGPLLGPLLGGGLSYAFGWRSCFIALTCFAGAVILPLLLLLVPETQQYRVLSNLERRDPAAAAAVKEKEEVLAQAPVFHAPWVPLRFLLDGSIAPHAIANLVTFGVHFAALTEFPVAMAASPYNLSAGLIGVAFLSYGISGLIASPLGGMLSDKAAAAHPTEPEARLSHNLLISLVVMPPSLVLLGWSTHFHVHLAGPLVGMFGVGFACAALLPGVFSFCTTLKQAEAAGAAAMVQTMMFVSAGVLILVSAVVVRAIGLGPWFSILAAVQLLATLFAYAQTLRKRRAAQQPAAMTATTVAGVNAV